MSGVSAHMRELIKKGLPSLEGEKEGALVPIEGAAPHKMSFTKTHPENGLMYLFTADIDGKIVHVFIESEEQAA